MKKTAKDLALYLIQTNNDEYLKFRVELCGLKKEGRLTTLPRQSELQTLMDDRTIVNSYIIKWCCDNGVELYTEDKKSPRVIWMTDEEYTKFTKKEGQ